MNSVPETLASPSASYRGGSGRIAIASGQFFQRPFRLTNKFVHLLLGIPILIVELLTLPPIAIPPVSALTCWASAVVCDAKKHMPNAAMRAYVRL